jgi:hypothetical protein
MIKTSRGGAGAIKKNDIYMYRFIALEQWARGNPPVQGGLTKIFSIGHLRIDRIVEIAAMSRLATIAIVINMMLIHFQILTDCLLCDVF